jgi:hypothetical protein
LHIQRAFDGHLPAEGFNVPPRRFANDHPIANNRRPPVVRKSNGCRTYSHFIDRDYIAYEALGVWRGVHANQLGDDLCNYRFLAQRATGRSSAL